MKRLHIAFSLLLSCTMLCAQNTQSIRGAHTFEMGIAIDACGQAGAIAVIAIGVLYLLGFWMAKANKGNE